MDQQANNIIAVYGTLRLGEGNYKRLLQDRAEYLSTERIPGFSIVTLGPFPASYENQEDEQGVLVDIFKVDDATFESVDRLEGYPHMYDRQQVETSHGPTWLYFMEDINTEDTIQSGDWKEFIGRCEEQIV